MNNSMRTRLLAIARSNATRYDEGRGHCGGALARLTKKKMKHQKRKKVSKRMMRDYDSDDYEPRKFKTMCNKIKKPLNRYQKFVRDNLSKVRSRLRSKGDDNPCNAMKIIGKLWSAKK